MISTYGMRTTFAIRAINHSVWVSLIVCGFLRVCMDTCTRKEWWLIRRKDIVSIFFYIMIIIIVKKWCWKFLIRFHSVTWVRNNSQADKCNKVVHNFLPSSLSTPSSHTISSGIEQSDPAQPSMQLHRYSPSSSVHCPWREQPFSHPALN